MLPKCIEVQIRKAFLIIELMLFCVFLLSISDNEEFCGHIVRDVAPKKVMVCLSFRLPYEVVIEFTAHCLM